MTGNLFADSLVYLFISFFVFGAYYVISRKLLHLSALESILSSFVLLNVQIVLVFLSLGAFASYINPYTTFALNFVISCSIYFYLYRNYGGGFLYSPQNNIRQLNFKKFVKFAKTYPIHLIITLVLCFQLLNLFFNIVFYYPISWDDYHYHLGFVNDIIQTGALRNYLYPQSYTITFPHNLELINLWHVIFLKNDFFVEITNFLFLIVASISVYLLCRFFNVRKSYSYLAATSIFFVPMNIVLIKTTKVDLAIASLVLTSFYFTLRYFSNVKINSKYIILIPLLAAGFILGTKPSGFLYSGIILLLILILLLKSNNWKLKKTFGKSLNIFYFFVFSCLILGAYWYVRSWIWYGNPLYPLEIDKFGIYFPGEWTNLDFAEGLPQIQDRNLLTRFLYVWREKESWFGVYYIPDSKINGLGSLWYILLLPALLIAYLSSILKRNFEAVAFFSASILLVLLIPGNWVPHYHIFISLIGAVAFGMVLQSIITHSLIKKFVIGLFLSLAILNTILVANFALFDLKDYVPRAKAVIRDKDYARSFHFKSFNIFLNNYLNSGDKVIVGRYVFFSYALVKEGFDSQVIMLEYRSKEQWVNKVIEENPRFVVVLNGTDEEQALIDNPALFEKIMTDSVGPHSLFAYKENEQNKKIRKAILYDATFPLNSNISPSKARLESNYGTFQVNIEYYPTDLAIEQPILFIHIKKDNEITLNIDQTISQDELRDGLKKTVSFSSYNEDNYIEFGIFDLNNPQKKFYYGGKITRNN